MTTKLVYKIRTSDGLFSTGGSSPGFNERGKTWQQRGHLSNHLAQLGSRGQSRYRQLRAEVVTYELTEVEADAVGIGEYISGVNERRKAREAEYRARLDGWRRDRELAELRRLQELYPDGR